MNRFAKLLPIMVFYIVVCLVFSDNALDSDQGYYAMYAQNLTEGFFVPSDTLNLWCGPGVSAVIIDLSKDKGTSL